MVKESTKDKNAQPKTQQQPMQPGMMMWDAGIMSVSYTHLTLPTKA